MIYIFSLLLFYCHFCFGNTESIAECDVGSYRLCYFAQMARISAATHNVNKLAAYVPKSSIGIIKEYMPEYISWWVKSPEFIPIDEDEFKKKDIDKKVTVVIDSPAHMSHSLQHAAAMFSLMNSGSQLFSFPVEAIARIVNVHPESRDWENDEWARFWWSFIDAKPVVSNQVLVNISNVVVMESVGPPFQHGNFFFSKVDAFSYRNRIYKATGIPLKRPARTPIWYEVCFVKRTKTRQIFNIEEIKAILQNSGIPVQVKVITDPGVKYKKTPFELVKIMEPCDVLVAPHGSELAFQLFMREKTTTFELMPPKNLLLWTIELTYMLGINWIPVYSVFETADDSYLTWYGCSLFQSNSSSCGFRSYHQFSGWNLPAEQFAAQIIQQLQRQIPH